MAVVLGFSVHVAFQSRRFIFRADTVLLDRVCMSVYIAAMKRTNMHLKDDQIKRLKALSAKTGAPLSELVRRAIEEYLKKHKD